MARHLRIISAFMLAAMLVLLSVPAQCGSFQQDLDGIDKAARSVLMLEVYNDKDELIKGGSGFVAFDSRTLVTNYHVMEDSSAIIAYSDSGDWYKIDKVIAADKEKDIALLEFDSPTGLKPLPLDTGGDLRRAQPVVTIGSPKGITNSISTGIISALYQENGVSYIQFTAPISPGSSGGALFNNKGEVIGITTATFIEGQNMNLAVNIAEILKLKESNINNPRMGLKAYQEQKGWRLADPTPTPAVRLSAVKNIRITAAANGLAIWWDSVFQANEYKIFRSSSKDGRFTLIGATNENSFIDSNALSGQTYYYQIICTSGLYMSDPSDVVEAPMSGYKQNIHASVISNGISIVWDSIPLAQQYQVFRTTLEDSSFLQIAETSFCSYYDTHVQPGTVYAYTVSCLSEAGEMLLFYTIQASMPPDATPVPTPIPTRVPQPTKTAVPTPAPYIEPKYPIGFGEKGYIELFQGYPRLDPGLKNHSATKTVDGFTLTFYCENENGDAIKRNESDSYYLNSTFAITIQPGESIYPGYVWLEGYSGAKYVNVAITRIYTADGETITIPEEDWEFYYWTLK